MVDHRPTDSWQLSHGQFNVNKVSVITSFHHGARSEESAVFDRSLNIKRAEEGFVFSTFQKLE